MVCDDATLGFHVHLYTPVPVTLITRRVIPVHAVLGIVREVHRNRSTQPMDVRFKSPRGETGGCPVKGQRPYIFRALDVRGTPRLALHSKKTRFVTAEACHERGSYSGGPVHAAETN
jgi:hypothetical protein